VGIISKIARIAIGGVVLGTPNSREDLAVIFFLRIISLMP